MELRPYVMKFPPCVPAILSEGWDGYDTDGCVTETFKQLIHIGPILSLGGLFNSKKHKNTVCDERMNEWL